MGLLTIGTPLSWEETKALADHVRQHGVAQLVNLYNRLKDRSNDCLYFGDEIEYTLIRFDDDKKKVQLCLKAQKYLEKLRSKSDDQGVLWADEYASYMVEGIPGKPYGALSSHFNTVEDNMRKRREQVMAILEGQNESILSLTVFPRLGCPDFTSPEYAPRPSDGISRSLFYPDEAINNAHPRFKTLTRNIRERRGEKVIINVPIYVDSNTPRPFIESLPAAGSERSRPDQIYMDAMGFGMGCSCLQMTFQACNITEARHLYDQLTPLTPILMALSAASPIYRGYLADIDHRWSAIAASVDDRTAEEQGDAPLQKDRFIINKSRYDSIDCYLSPDGLPYNNIDLIYDSAICQQLIDGGMDEQLSRHFAHLFIRDPVSLFSERIHLDDTVETEHFECIQSTNWQTMRFKPPPPKSTIGWRVEFRPTECQLTDFENAALTVFVVMMTRVILSYNLNTLIPISKVDENVERAQKRDAVLNEKFYFRTNLVRTPQSCCTANGTDTGNTASAADAADAADAAVEELTIDEIINGKADVFTGLIPFIKDYMNNIEVDVDTRCTVIQYLNLISARASGTLQTTARFMREFVCSHPAYKKDSVVSDEIAYDLVKTCDGITKGHVSCPKLLPDAKSRSASDIPKAVFNANQRKRSTVS